MYFGNIIYSTQRALLRCSFRSRSISLALYFSLSLHPVFPFALSPFLTMNKLCSCLEYLLGAGCCMRTNPKPNRDTAHHAQVLRQGSF